MAATGRCKTYSEDMLSPRIVAVVVSAIGLVAALVAGRVFVSRSSATDGVAASLDSGASDVQST
jgi:hypothetical protein